MYDSYDAGYTVSHVNNQVVTRENTKAIKCQMIIGFPLWAYTS